MKDFFRPANDFLELFAIGDVVGVNTAGEIQARFPGAVAVGGDGSRELLVYDFGEPAPPLLLLEASANDWSEAIFQAGSLTEFLRAFPARGWLWEPETS